MQQQPKSCESRQRLRRITPIKSRVTVNWILCSAFGAHRIDGVAYAAAT